MIRAVLLTLLAASGLTQALNIPVVCPCTFVANRAIKVAKNVLIKDDNRLPARQPLERYETYIARVFARRDNEPEDDYYTRVYNTYTDEKPDKYVERIDTIYSVFPTFPPRDNPAFWKFNEKYYTLKYGKLDSILPILRESNDQYFARILRRERDEDFPAYIRRLDCVFKAYPKLDIWRRIKFDADEKNWYFYRHVAYNCAIRPSENIRESVSVQYARRVNEEDDDFTYFKRIVARLQGESDEDYVDRLTRVRSKFPSLPLWYNCEFLYLIKDYYSLLYAKKEDETPEGYYKRITTKSTAEDFPTYVKRIDILSRVFNSLPLWNNCDYLQLTGPFYSYAMAKKPEESDEKYLKRITRRGPAESVDNYLKRLNVCRWVNRGNDLFTNKTYWPLVKNYYEGFFKKGKAEGTDDWLGKIFKRDFDETDGQYVKRCTEVLFKVGSVVNTLSEIDLAETGLKIVSDFYRIHYKRHPDEDRDAWLKRVTTRLPIETDVTYQTRLKYLENIYTDCRNFVGGVLKKVFGGRKSLKEADKEVEVVLVKKKVEENKQVEEETKEKTSKKKTLEEEIEKIYSKKKDEDELSWFKRLVKKSPNESLAQYVQTLNTVRKLFPSIPLWYSKKNLDFVKEYYTALYQKLPDETDEQHCSRIVTKEPWETVEQTAERVALVRSLYPTLPFWTEDKYYSLIKDIYQVEYKKRPVESYEQYAARVLARDSHVDISDEVWANRVHLIQLATADSPVWWDDKYSPLTKAYFRTWYRKDENEGCTSWLTRVLRRLDGESEDNAIRRVGLIKQTSGDCGCWTEWTFKKVQGSRLLSQEYLTDIENAFFDSDTTYERIYSSMKSAASAEASSSSSSESVKVAVAA